MSHRKVLPILVVLFVLSAVNALTVSTAVKTESQLPSDKIFSAGDKIIMYSPDFGTIKTTIYVMSNDLSSTISNQTFDGFLIPFDSSPQNSTASFFDIYYGKILTIDFSSYPYTVVNNYTFPPHSISPFSYLPSFFNLDNGEVAVVDPDSQEFAILGSDRTLLSFRSLDYPITYKFFVHYYNGTYYIVSEDQSTSGDPYSLSERVVKYKINPSPTGVSDYLVLDSSVILNTTNVAYHAFKYSTDAFSKRNLFFKNYLIAVNSRPDGYGMQLDVFNLDDGSRVNSYPVPNSEYPYYLDYISYVHNEYDDKLYFAILFDGDRLLVGTVDSSGNISGMKLKTLYGIGTSSKYTHNEYIISPDSMLFPIETNENAIVFFSKVFSVDGPDYVFEWGPYTLYRTSSDLLFIAYNGTDVKYQVVPYSSPKEYHSGISYFSHMVISNRSIYFREPIFDSSGGRYSNIVKVDVQDMAETYGYYVPAFGSSSSRKVNKSLGPITSMSGTLNDSLWIFLGSVASLANENGNATNPMSVAYMINNETSYLQFGFNDESDSKSVSCSSSYLFVNATSNYTIVGNAVNPTGGYYDIYVVNYTGVPSDYIVGVALGCRDYDCRIFRTSPSLSQTGIAIGSLVSPTGTIFASVIPADVVIVGRVIDSISGCDVSQYTADVYIDGSFTGTISQSSNSLTVSVGLGTHNVSIVPVSTVTGFSGTELFPVKQTGYGTFDVELSQPTDTTPPTVTISSPYNYEVVGGNFTVQYSIVDASPLSLCWYTVNGGSQTYIDCHGTNFTVSPTSSGYITVTLYANDSNSNLGSAEVTVGVDLTAPSIVILEPEEGQNYWYDQVEASVVVSEDFGIKTLKYALYGLICLNETESGCVQYNETELTTYSFGPTVYDASLDIGSWVNSYNRFKFSVYVEDYVNRSDSENVTFKVHPHTSGTKGGGGGGGFYKALTKAKKLVTINVETETGEGFVKIYRGKKLVVSKKMEGETDEITLIPGKYRVVVVDATTGEVIEDKNVVLTPNEKKIKVKSTVGGKPPKFNQGIVNTSNAVKVGAAAATIIGLIWLLGII